MCHFGSSKAISLKENSLLRLTLFCNQVALLPLSPVQIATVMIGVGIPVLLRFNHTLLPNLALLFPYITSVLMARYTIFHIVEDFMFLAKKLAKVISERDTVQTHLIQTMLRIIRNHAPPLFHYDPMLVSSVEREIALFHVH
jgi:hypothetical protein